MNFSEITSKIEEMIKERIKFLGLVKTGKLLNSIKVTSMDNGSFSVKAVDYFTILDKEHNISNYVLSSEELKDFITEFFQKEFKKIKK